MDHTVVVRDKMTEKYLLNELDPGVRDEFEEHYFDCPDCALDVHAGFQFVEESKVVLADNPQPLPVREVKHSSAVGGGRFGGGWFAWLRPAFAAPALALLLILVGYQNLVTYPRLQSELRQPQVLPAVSVNAGTWGGGGTPASIPEGKGLLLFVRIPVTPEVVYVRYSADLFSPSGKLEGSFSMTPASGQDQWSVTVPRIDRQPGTYTIAVHGITAGGETKDLGSTSFQVQILH